MPYADATIKEALRLGAVINIVPKRALKTFEIGGYTIPKVSPTACMSSAYLMMSGSPYCKALIQYFFSDAMMPIPHTYIRHATRIHTPTTYADQDKACTLQCY
jgi:hypothetical protein